MVSTMRSRLGRRRGTVLGAAGLAVLLASCGSPGTVQDASGSSAPEKAGVSDGGGAPAAESPEQAASPASTEDDRDASTPATTRETPSSSESQTPSSSAPQEQELSPERKKELNRPVTMVPRPPVPDGRYRFSSEGFPIFSRGELDRYGDHGGGWYEAGHPDAEPPEDYIQWIRDGSPYQDPETGEINRSYECKVPDAEDWEFEPIPELNGFHRSMSDFWDWEHNCYFQLVEGVDYELSQPGDAPVFHQNAFDKYREVLDLDLRDEYDALSDDDKSSMMFFNDPGYREDVLTAYAIFDRYDDGSTEG